MPGGGGARGWRCRGWGCGVPRGMRSPRAGSRSPPGGGGARCGARCGTRCGHGDDAECGGVRCGRGPDAEHRAGPGGERPPPCQPPRPIGVMSRAFSARGRRLQPLPDAAAPSPSCSPGLPQTGVTGAGCRRCLWSPAGCPPGVLSSPSSAGRGLNAAVHLPLPRPNLGVPARLPGASGLWLGRGRWKRHQPHGRGRGAGPGPSLIGGFGNLRP